jgi:hypothetical protein
MSSHIRSRAIDVSTSAEGHYTGGYVGSCTAMTTPTFGGRDLPLAAYRADSGVRSKLDSPDHRNKAATADLARRQLRLTERLSVSAHSSEPRDQELRAAARLAICRCRTGRDRNALQPRALTAAVRNGRAPQARYRQVGFVRELIRA